MSAKSISELVQSNHCQGNTKIFKNDDDDDEGSRHDRKSIDNMILGIFKHSDTLVRYTRLQTIFCRDKAWWII